MSTILPSEITTTIANNIARFGNKIKLRVKMWRNTAGAIYDTNPVSTGDYSASTGVYTFDERVWLKEVDITHGGTREVYKIEYEDELGSYILILAKNKGTSSPQTVTLPFPVYAKKFKFTVYAEEDPTDSEKPSIVKAKLDTWFDVTDHVCDPIAIENNIDKLLGKIQLPHTIVQISNNDGRWNKKKTGFVLPYYELKLAGDNKIGTLDTINYKKNGTRFTVEIKYYGENWEDADYILLSSFHARKWESTAISGEVGWLAKTELKTPLIEGAEPEDIIDKYIIRNDDSILIQFNKPLGKDIITVDREHVGEIDLEPDNPRKIADGEHTWAHCNDEEYIYYATRTAGSAAGTNSGGYVTIFRCTADGSVNEEVGKIYAVAHDVVRFSGTDYDLVDYNSESNPNLNNGNPVKRMIRDIGGMCVDSGYLYVTILQVVNGEYYNDPVGSFGYYCYEKLLYRLPKDGTGWSSICGYGIVETAEKRIGYAYSGFNKWSPGGHNGTFNPPSPYTWDPYDIVLATGFHVPVLKNIILYDDAGTEKLLYVLELDRFGQKAIEMSQFHKVNKDWTGDTQIGGVGSGSDNRVECITIYNEMIMFVHWSDYSNYPTSISWYIGVLEKDDSGDFYIADYGRAAISIMFKGMTFMVDGLYGSGNGYDASTESVLGNGIMQWYKFLFQMDGYNIVHMNHETNNTFINNPYPIVFVGGSTAGFEFVKYGKEYIDGNIVVTASWIMNLFSGELILRFIFPSEMSNAIQVSYDFVNSILFYKSEVSSRLGDDCLGKIGQVGERSYFINEYGAISELRKIQSQVISLREVNIEYRNITGDDGEELPDPMYPGLTGARIAYDEQYGKELWVGFQFTAQHDGILSTFKIPLCIFKYGTISGTYDVPVGIRIHAANDNDVEVDFDGNVIEPPGPPITAQITQLLSTTIYIPFSEIDSVTNKSPYKWFTFDISSVGFTVQAGKRYCIITETDPTGDDFNYLFLSKKVDDNCATNRSIDQFVTAGGSPSGSGWCVVDVGTNRSIISYSIVEIKKTKQELESVDIIDSVNPNISAGFNSLVGGNDTTVAVRSIDFVTLYTKGTHYSITYSSGKFYLNFLGSSWDLTDAIIAMWYDSKSDLIELKEEQHNISEDAEFGDETEYLRILIEGQRLRPSDSPVRISKTFTLIVGLDEEVISENAQTKNSESVSLEQWNDSKSVFEPSLETDPESLKFAVEFRDPFIIGTTAYTVERGKGKTADTVYYGTQSKSSDDDTPRFYRIDSADGFNGFSDDDYHVMLNPESYVEWRLATEDDYPDMDSDHVEGTVPSAAGDVFTQNHFYLKHMNGFFGRTSCNWAAYKAETKKYYLNEDGVIVEDDDFDPSSDLNPLNTAYVNKLIIVKTNPVDFAGNPMFHAHGESGKDGYDSSMNSNVKQWMSTSIDRVIITSNGIRVLYSNYRDVNSFLNIIVIGYPINFATHLRAEKKRPGYDHADAKELLIENEYLQSYNLIKRKVDVNDNFWGVERIDYSRTVPFDPRLRPGAIVKVTSERQGLSKALFMVTTSRGMLSLESGGLQSYLDFLLQV